MGGPGSSGTIGNKSRTGLPKPPGSGRAKEQDGELTNFTLRIGADELARWKAAASQHQLSVGSLVRGAMRDYLEGAEE